MQAVHGSDVDVTCKQNNAENVCNQNISNIKENGENKINIQQTTTTTTTTIHRQSLQDLCNVDDYTFVDFF